MSLTTDPNDPRLTRGVDATPVKQAEVYLILSEEERQRGFVRPVRRAYTHRTCGTVTTLGLALCETYARDPKFYGSTYCVHCSKHLAVAEFNWVEKDGTAGPVLGE